MAKRKLERFAAVETFPNVFQHIQDKQIIDQHPNKGKWNSEVFRNSKPIVVELGCGKGEYTIGLARKYKEKNFVGVDLKGNRIWRGALTAIEEKIDNVAFLRTRIENIDTAFGENEVSEIWVTFPDPQPRKSGIRKRLTAPGFLDRYRRILKKGGILHLKTDNRPFYEYTLEVIREENLKLIASTHDLYGEDGRSKNILHDDLEIRTFYENKFSAMGFSICYLQCVL